MNLVVFQKKKNFLNFFFNPFASEWSEIGIFLIESNGFPGISFVTKLPKANNIGPPPPSHVVEMPILPRKLLESSCS